METAILWQFVLHKNGASEVWTWRRSRMDGAPLEVSAEAHPNYGKVINDAIRHGFRPQQEPWVVTDSVSITHFEPLPRVRRARKGKKAPPGAPKKKRNSRATSAGEQP